MSSHSRHLLIGKLFDVSVGEPWDFISEAGDNKFVGTVLAVSDVRSQKDWILLQASPFNHNGILINHIVGVNRYVSSQDLFGEIEKGNNVTLNFVFPIDGRELRSDNLLTDLQDESSFSFLVGSIIGIRDDEDK